jgi:hypothetical protein
MAVATVYRRPGPTWELRCPNCGHRVAWCSHEVWRRQFELFFNDIDRLKAWMSSMGTPEGTPLGWAWQSRPPMRWRQETAFVDVECFRCGWTTDDVPYPDGLEPYMVRKGK